MAFDSTFDSNKEIFNSSHLISLNPNSTPKFNSKTKKPDSNSSNPNNSLQNQSNSNNSPQIQSNPNNSLQNQSNTKNPPPNSSNKSFTDLPNALICEIFKFFDPKELGIVSCVSNHFNSLTSDHNNWQKFYLQRWGPPPSSPVNPPLDASSWKQTFIDREFRTKSFMGRFFVETLRGHTEPVRAVFILKSNKLIFTGGYDFIVRIWDLEDGFCLGASRSLGFTIRAIKGDSKLLMVAGTGAFIQCWRSVKGNPNLFDLSGNKSKNGENNLNFEFRLSGHEGPITCLDLDSKNIYSGSWDMTVRVYDRVSEKCIMKMVHRDWVWDISPRGATLAVTSGADLYIWEIASGRPVQLVPAAHKENNIYSLTRTNLGDLIFSGGADGTIHMYDLNLLSPEGDLVICAKWAPHTGAVNSLSFEYPWLVSCSNDGRISLIDIRNLLVNKNRKNCSNCRGRNCRDCRARIVPTEPPHRMLHGSGCDLFAVDLGFDRIVCGGEAGIVRVWDFSEALERERRAEASRRIRLENRMRRQKAQLEMPSTGATGGVAVHCPVVKGGVIRGSKKGGGGNKLKGVIN